MEEITKQEIKEIALGLAERVSAEAVEDVFKIVELIIKDSENLFDDMLLPALPVIKAKVLEFVDKIDGKEV
jgi:hypothetical protein